MSVDDRLASLRSQIDAIEVEQRLLAELDEAKQEHLQDRTDDEAKQRKQAAAEALREHRRNTRSDGVSVGGDAYVEPGSPDPSPSDTVKADVTSKVEGA
ncbi:hypothetical protein [Nonomuraea bangladeshensis]|uniref:hypothetical protein n=1 Tax=Nonomuraea bangladeshensis TaxID=404385 RepID=UPI003C2FFE99